MARGAGVTTRDRPEREAGVVVAYETHLETDAHLLAGMLKSAGLDAAVIGGRFGAAESGNAGLWQIVVPSSELRDAREIIEALQTEGGVS